MVVEVGAQAASFQERKPVGEVLKQVGHSWMVVEVVLVVRGVAAQQASAIVVD